MFAGHMAVLGMLLQEPDSLSGTNTKLLMIFIGLLAGAIVTQTVLFIVMFLGVVKTKREVMKIVETLHEATLPTIKNVGELVRDTSPKVRVITDNLLETSHVVRAKAQEFDTTLTDVNDRTRKQVAQVDGMVSSTLQATSDLVASVHRIIQIPVREAAGLMNGLKAGLDVLVGRVKGFGSGRRDLDL
jgi:hypothetical protein